MDIPTALTLAALTAASGEVGRWLMRQAIRRTIRQLRQQPPIPPADELFEELDQILNDARNEKGEVE